VCVENQCALDCQADATPCTVTWGFSANNVSMRVLAGSTVRWSGDAQSHPLAFTDQAVDVTISVNLQTATFPEAGIYPFVCTNHASMNGAITVVAAP
jgi:plastocyanin